MEAPLHLPARLLVSICVLACLVPSGPVPGQEATEADWFFMEGAEEPGAENPSLAGAVSRGRTGGIGVVCGGEALPMMWFTHERLEGGPDGRVRVYFGFDADSMSHDLPLLSDHIGFLVPENLVHSFMARMATGSGLSVRIESPDRVVPTELDFSLEGFLDVVTELRCVQRSRIMLYAARLGLSEEPGGAPVPTPMTVRPQLINEREVARALGRNYPPQLREFGVGGTANVWFFIDETGRVQDAVINRPCRYESINRAALKVAKIMRFSPAYNDGEVVPVWVALDVTFEVGM